MQQRTLASFTLTLFAIAALLVFTLLSASSSIKQTVLAPSLSARSLPLSTVRLKSITASSHTSTRPVACAQVPGDDPADFPIQAYLFPMPYSSEMDVRWEGYKEWLQKRMAYTSTQTEQVIFEGDFTPDKHTCHLAVFSPDSITVSLDGVNVPLVSALPGGDSPPSLTIDSDVYLKILDITLKPEHSYHIRLTFNNVLSFHTAFSGFTLIPCQYAKGRTILKDYLQVIGKKLDCYFTLERDRISRDPSVLDSNKIRPVMSRLELAFILDDPGIDRIDHLIAHLQQQLPFALITRDADVPAVIHIMDSSLQRFKDYSLDKKRDLAFSGSLHRLKQELSNQSGTSTLVSGDDMSNNFDNPDTKVTILAKQALVRSIFTKNLHFSDHNHILWEAETIGSLRNQQTAIHFYTINTKADFELLPSAVRNTLDGAPTDHHEDYSFSEGESAYLFNRDSDKVKDAAIQFIGEHYEEGSTSQVRWAMLYLGKTKTEKAIPTLLQYLTYQYTTCPVREEAYPAVKALTQIGKPAANAALEAMAKEKDKLALELLGAVVFNVYGMEEGDNKITAAADSLEEETQQKSIRQMQAKLRAEYQQRQVLAVPQPSSPTPK